MPGSGRLEYRLSVYGDVGSLHEILLWTMVLRMTNCWIYLDATSLAVYFLTAGGPASHRDLIRNDSGRSPTGTRRKTTNRKRVLQAQHH